MIDTTNKRSTRRVQYHDRAREYEVRGSNRTRSLSLSGNYLLGYSYSARRIGEVPAVFSTMIVPGSTRIEPNTIFPPCRPEIVCLAASATNRRITSHVWGSYRRHTPDNRMAGTTKRRSTTSCDQYYDYAREYEDCTAATATCTKHDSSSSSGCCCCRFDVTASFCVLLLYHATTLHCYDVTNSTNSTNNTNTHTCKNNFWRYKKERKNKNEVISYI